MDTAFPELKIGDEITVKITNVELLQARVLKIIPEYKRVVAFVRGEDRKGYFVWFDERVFPGSKLLPPECFAWHLVGWDRSREATIKILYHKDSFQSWADSAE